MKRIITTLLTLCLYLSIWAQGWPSQYGGVMLQGFYWDSYTDTQWNNLESQSDELSQYFDLIWVPQSGYCNTLTNQMGYLPVWWFDHKSAFGSESALRSMINTFKEKGTGIIEDVVINHRNGNTNWCDFPTETWNGHTMTWSLADICSGDDGGKTRANGYNVTGAADTGDDFDGGRDIDHTSANAQQNIKYYLDFLLTDLGYSGFRYDMVKGYAASYIGLYNTSARPAYSVGEYWDGYDKIKTWIDGTKVDGTPTSAAFDFPLKYNINDAFGSNKWSALKNNSVARDANYARYAVTFIDNHDTYRTGESGSSPLNEKIEAANAYLLSMPGTPCVFLRHWQMYKTPIKKLIFMRKAAGLNNESSILSEEQKEAGFVVNVQGTKGKVLGIFGVVTAQNTDGYKLAAEGESYKIYVSNEVNIDGIDDITSEEEAFTIPDCCTWEDGETFAFFEAPTTWDNIKCWRWDNSYNYTGNSWPGVACTKVGTAPNGNSVWKWTWDGQRVTQPSSNAGIIFSSNGNPQTNNLTFENGGYYDVNGMRGNVVTAIENITVSTPEEADKAYYTLTGARVERPVQKGIYIYQGRKIVIR
ncbi:MAG: starch-binding protein [Prevotella sp.]|nr:starch-binding protein [Prevotella sp.]